MHVMIAICLGTSGRARCFGDSGKSGPTGMRIALTPFLSCSMTFSCSQRWRRNTSNVPTQCSALARYQLTTRNETNTANCCYRDLPDATLTFPWPQVAHLQPFSEKLSGSDTKFVAGIRNTLILGLAILSVGPTAWTLVLGSPS
jgi:hypothetical protein